MYAREHRRNNDDVRCKKVKSGQSWGKFLGYIVNELIVHLDPLFEAGMTWENCGTWYIDHQILERGSTINQ